MSLTLMLIWIFVCEIELYHIDIYLEYFFFLEFVCEGLPWDSTVHHNPHCSPHCSKYIRMIIIDLSFVGLCNSVWSKRVYWKYLPCLINYYHLLSWDEERTRRIVINVSFYRIYWPNIASTYHLKSPILLM